MTRASEPIALKWLDVDLEKGTTRIDMARVIGDDKGTAKTAVKSLSTVHLRQDGITVENSDHLHCVFSLADEWG